MCGRRIAGRIELIESIGQGGMGTVYRAWHHGLQKTIAVKVLSESLDRDPQITARFVREARTAARLEHPSCVRILDFGTDGPDQLLFLAMEFVEGESLAALLDRSGALPADRACKIMLAVLEVLAAAHERQIIHRDMKPGNILVTREGGVKVCDFGISKILADDGELTDLTKTGAILGTPAYMAPDQFLGLPIDPRADVYSCGVILYQMVAGRQPFVADSTLRMLMQHAHDAPPPVQSFATDLDPRITEIIERAMAKDPDLRFSTAAEMRAALSAALEPIVRISPRLDSKGSPAIVGLSDSLDDSVEAAPTWPDQIALDRKRSSPRGIQAIPLEPLGRVPSRSGPPPRASSSPRAQSDAIPPRAPSSAGPDAHAAAQAGIADLMRGLGWVASEARYGRLAYAYGIVYALWDAPVWEESTAGLYALIRCGVLIGLWFLSSRAIRAAAWIQLCLLLIAALAWPTIARAHIFEWAVSFLIAGYCVVGAHGAALPRELPEESAHTLAANARTGLITIAVMALVLVCHRATREIVMEPASKPQLAAPTPLRPAATRDAPPAPRIKNPSVDQLADLVREDRLVDAEYVVFQKYDEMNGSAELLPFVRTAIARHRSDLRAMAAPATESSLKDGGSLWGRGCARVDEIALANQRGWVSGKVSLKDDSLPLTVHGVVDYGLILLAAGEEPQPRYAAFATVDASGRNGLLWCDFAGGRPMDCCALGAR
jgi:serine/threonine-protein kinase